MLETGLVRALDCDFDLLENLRDIIAYCSQFDILIVIIKWYNDVKVHIRNL